MGEHVNRYEPLWWAKARELHERGHSASNIGRLLGKDHSAVLYAVSEEHRARRRAKWRGKKRVSTPQTTDLFRKKICEAARHEAEATGGHPDLILEACGQPVRRPGRSV